MRFGWRVGDTTGSRPKIHAELQESLDKSARAVSRRFHHHLQLLHEQPTLLPACSSTCSVFFYLAFLCFFGPRLNQHTRRCRAAS